MDSEKPKNGLMGVPSAPFKKVWTSEDLDRTADAVALEAREHFIAFRQMMRPEMKWGWWVERVAHAFQRFYDDLMAGRRPKLVMAGPPQHGKTWSSEDFIAWVAGKNPDLKTIYASFSEELGTDRNLNLQRIMESPRYKRVFPTFRIRESGWQCNSNLIEYVRHGGSFRNTTVGGAINGLELHLGVLDDPMKGRAEANSKPTRDRTWEWFTDDWGTRFAKDSGMVIIMTRWHVDDVLGRLMEREPDLRTLAFPAIAENDEQFRRKGEALFPELKPLDFLLERKRIMSMASWEAEYQQHPIIVGGGILPIDQLRTLSVFDRTQIAQAVRAWDKAGTEGGDGACTAGVLMHKMRNGTFVIENVTRGRWSALEREQRIKQVAQTDRENLQQRGRWVNYKIVIEQEPGSGGKESAEATIRNLAGFAVVADRVTGSKEVRAEPFAAQVQGGNVWLVGGPWVPDFRDEAEAWPSGRTLDQIDAAAMAFAHLTAGSTYDQTYAAFRD
jgi:predicted phage terminase large subunit-like protein